VRRWRCEAVRHSITKPGASAATGRCGFSRWLLWASSFLSGGSARRATKAWPQSAERSAAQRTRTERAPPSLATRQRSAYSPCGRRQAGTAWPGAMATPYVAWCWSSAVSVPAGAEVFGGEGPGHRAPAYSPCRARRAEYSPTRSVRGRRWVMFLRPSRDQEATNGSYMAMYEVCAFWQTKGPTDVGPVGNAALPGATSFRHSSGVLRRPNGRMRCGVWQSGSPSLARGVR
jgi:hypothetical protein